jgi:hypothetical protein
MISTVSQKLGLIDAETCQTLKDLIQGTTKAKIQRYSLVAFGAFMALSISPIAVLCLTTSWMGAYHFIKDYEDPKEVESMRKRALLSDFLSIVREHDSIHPVLDAKILTYSELSNKLSQSILEAKNNSLVKDQLPLLEGYKKQLDRRKDWLVYPKGLFT